MSFDVKITTKISFLDLIAPYTCRGCGHLGELLCERCKKYIVRPEKRLLDTKKTEMNGIVYAVGRREGVLMKLTEDYKFQAIRKTAEVLAELLDAVLPKELKNITIVPLPTIGRHIRERGFDHTLLLAKKLAKRRGWKIERALRRANKTVQVGQDAKTREMQAKRAYELNGKIDRGTTYLLLDDVWTTGASMRAAKRVLEAAGATKMVGAVLCVGLQN